MRHIEQSLTAVASTRLPLAAGFQLTIAVDDYVAGNALHTIESVTRAAAAEADPDMVSAAIEYGIGLLGSGDFPQLSAMYAANRDGQAEQSGPPLTEEALTSQFELGLTALLDGLATRLGL